MLNSAMLNVTHAHRVIDNSADQAHLLAQVESLWAKLQPTSY